MIIYNTLYTLIKTQLNGIQDIKLIDWYNEQYQNYDSEKAIPRKAVFIEILDPINWEEMTPGQSGQVRFRLHCAVFDVKDSPLVALNLTQKVFTALQRKTLLDKDGNQITTELIRSESSMPKRYDQMKVTLTTFVTQLYDASGIDETVDVNVDFNVDVD